MIKAYSGPGSAELPRWPWHSFAWSPAEGIAILERRRMAVVVLEHYEESLVALRRTLKWSVADALYTVKRRTSAKHSDAGSSSNSGTASMLSSSSSSSAAAAALHLTPHAKWQTWPPAAIKLLKQALKHHGAADFHQAALRRWAKHISELYRSEGRETFAAELSLMRTATNFLEQRCSAKNGLLDIYVSNLIERAQDQKQKRSTSTLEYFGGGAEDSAFSFGKSPLSITELCVRHQYCEHVLHKKEALIDSSPGAFSAVGSGAISAALSHQYRERLKSGGVEGIEALVQLFL
jgi:hypothetical protein